MTDADAQSLLLQRIADLEHQLAKKDKINTVLMKRVERGFDSQGDAFSLFQAASSLEVEVRERTQALEKALRDLSNSNARLEKAMQDLEESQARLVQSEKMAALGQLIAGIAHEINTPLGAIRASVGNMSQDIAQALDTEIARVRALSDSDFALFNNLIKRSHISITGLSSREARQARRRLGEQFADQGAPDPDTLADLLVDIGITDSLDDVLTTLCEPRGLDIARMVAVFLGVKLNEANIELAVQRASKVVFALKTFAHHDDSGQSQLTDLNHSIDTVLTLYDNQIKQGVRVIRQFADLPMIQSYPEELGQVWTNLIFNALQAINNQGTLTITTRLVNDRVCVAVQDDGPGIPVDLQARVFDTFYTTKRPGEGTGLGLSIVRGILDKHGGNITVTSEPGRTVFDVCLPLTAKQNSSGD